jgi:Ca-activated chloride channel family protein
MNFLWPAGLLALVIVPLGLIVYRRWLERGRSESHALHPDLAMLEVASRGGSRWQRHVPAGLLLGGAIMGLLAFARPYGMLPAPDPKAGVMLAIDVSGSMRAEDVKPNRMEAAKQSAQTFVKRLPREIKAGLVSFAGYAMLDQPLTTEHVELSERISTLERRRGTAIGEGLRESTAAFPTLNGKLDGPATVILLSDGRNTVGMLPAEAAKLAAKLGVKVHTIGVGSPLTAATPYAPFASFDEAELRGIADATGGRYFSVGSAEQLDQVYKELGREIGWRVQRTEMTAVLSLVAGLLLASSLMVAARRIV